MFSIFKNIFSAFQKMPKRKRIAIGIALAISWCFLTVPILPAKAISGWEILNVFGTLFNSSTIALLGAVIHFFLFLSWLLLNVAIQILQWALGNPFTYSLTNPGGNIVINVGWTLLRDLTNMFFVLGLAYIGLATALNIGGFNTKKTFGRFIVAALIINFTPVICGVIVDAANILTNFFTKEIKDTFNSFAILYDKNGGFSTVMEVVKNSFTMFGVAKISAALIFNTLTGIVLFFFAFLFLARNVAIWILVIISPIAFFCWIFDSTKRHFQTWWSQFINWSFIGVLAGFALYLSGHLLQGFQKGGLTQNTWDKDLSPIGDLMPFGIVIIFMGFALIQVMKSSAAGSQIAIKAAKTVGGAAKAGGKRVGLATQRKLRNYGRKIAEGKGRIGTFSRIVTGGATKDDIKEHPTASKWARRLPFIAGPMGGMALLRHYGAKLTEEEIKESEKRRKKIAGKSIETKKAALKNAVLPSAKADLAAQITLDGNADDMPGIMPKGDELKKLLETAIKTNAATANALKLLDPKETKRAVDTLVASGKATEAMLKSAGVFFDKEDEKEVAEYGNLEGKLVAKMKADKMQYMYEDTALRYVEGKEGLGHDFWTGAHMAKGAELFGRKFINTFIEGMEEAEKRGAYKKNKQLDNWRRGTAAQNLGIQAGPSQERLDVATAEKEVGNLEIERQTISDQIRDAVGSAQQKKAKDLADQRDDIDKKLNKLKLDLEEEKKKIEEEKLKKEEAEPATEKPPKGNIKGGKRVKE